MFAAILLVALGLAHSILGERYLLVRLFRRGDLPKLLGSTSFTANTLRFAWHITTITWFGIAALLWLLDRRALTPAMAARVIGITSVACGLLPIAFTRGRHLSWIVFFAVGGIVLWWSAA